MADLVKAPRPRAVVRTSLNHEGYEAPRRTPDITPSCTFVPLVVSSVPIFQNIDQAAQQLTDL
jgi:hypothetical protein